MGRPLAHAPAMGPGVCARGPRQRIGRGGRGDWVVEQEIADCRKDATAEREVPCLWNQAQQERFYAFWLGSHCWSASRARLSNVVRTPYVAWSMSLFLYSRIRVASLSAQCLDLSRGPEKNKKTIIDEDDGYDMPTGGSSTQKGEEAPPARSKRRKEK